MNKEQRTKNFPKYDCRYGKSASEFSRRRFLGGSACGFLASLLAIRDNPFSLQNPQQEQNAYW